MKLIRKINKIVKKNFRNRNQIIEKNNLFKLSDRIFDEEEPILVSIICNTYNHENFIENCIKGFLDQFVNFRVEILIHDDASTDSTAKIIRQYQSLFPNIIFPILQSSNQASKNVKITKTYQYSRARGKYIAFCEGDDAWFDNLKLFKQVNFLEKNSDYIAIVHDVINYDFSRKKISNKLYKNHNDGDLSFEEICNGFAYHASSLLYRNSKQGLFDSNPDFYVFRKMNDFPKSVELFLNGKIYFINKKMSLYRYKSNPNSFTNRKYVGQHENFVTFFANLKKYVSNEELEYVEFKIKELEIKELFYSNNIKEIFTDKYYKTYKKLNSNLKFKIFIKRRFNFIYKIYRKIFKSWHY